MAEAIRLVLKEQDKLEERLKRLEGLTGLVAPADELRGKRKKIERELRGEGDKT